MTSIDKIINFLKADNWIFDQLNNNLIAVTFQGNYFLANIFISIDKEKVLFGILPYIETVQNECSVQLNKILLQINYKINFAKFCLDDENNVGLVLELNGNDLHQSEFLESLKLLILIADQFYQPLHIIAVDPSFKIPDSTNFDTMQDLESKNDN
jgi:hypothetical protein